MANGTTEPISEVEVGDYVYATDPETGESGAREVLATLPHTDRLLTLRLSSGEIVTTEDRKYWNATDQQWQESQHLDPADELLTADGDQVVVEGLDWSTVHTADAYDLGIADIDTYYVGAGEDEVLVHNADFVCGLDGITLRVEQGANKIEVSPHAAQRLTERGISIDALERTLAQPSFRYFHEGVWKTGFYDAGSRVFAGTVNGQVTTVIKNASPNYIQNLKNASPP